MMGNWYASGLRAALLGSASALYLTTGAIAQEKTTAFNIPGGPLADVLTQIGAASSSPISFSPPSVQGQRSGPIVGQMSVGQAVARALAGSRLRAVMGASGVLTVVSGAPAVTGATTSGVATDIADIDVSGNGINANGSSDPLATEGSKSYVATLSNAASRTPLSIKETPQSVSVLTDQQIKDRNATTIDQAVAALPGVTVQNGFNAGSNRSALGSGSTPDRSSNLDTAYTSRGFTVGNISVDGGTPMQLGSTSAGFNSNYRPIFDLSQYDSVSVVRGSGGTYAGVGDPGGVLSLQRKRPQGQTAGSIEQNYGTYGNFRTVGDITTGPLLDGLLNIRSTFVHDETSYMYKPAFKNLDQFYINAEITPTDWTKINIGTTLNFTNANAWYGGLPTLASGRFAPYPRSLALTAPWARTDIAGQEYFLLLKQKLSENWDFNFNGTITNQTSTNDFVYFNTVSTGFVKPNGKGLIEEASYGKIGVKGYAADAFVNGREVVMNMPVELTFGASYKYLEQASTAPVLNYTYPGSLEFNTFRPLNLPQVPIGLYRTDPIPYPSNNLTQIGGYMSMRISPVPWAHVLISERISTYDQQLSFAGGSTNASAMNVPIPDVGITLDLDSHASIYGSYATIFQPTTALLTPTQVAPPISGATWEAGVKRTDFDGQLLSSLAFYSTKQINLTVQDPNNPPGSNPALPECCYILNGISSTAQGIDLEITGKLQPNWDLTASYNFNINQTTPSTIGLEAGYRKSTVTYSFPRHLAKLFTVYRPHIGIPEYDQYLNRLSIGFGADYRSRAQNMGQLWVAGAYNPDTGSFSQGRSVPYRIRQGDYVIFSALVKYDIDEKTQAQLNLTNLLDRKYYQTIGSLTGGNWYGPAFSAVGTLRVAF